MLYNSNSILLFFTNHAFFKYNKPINMELYHSTMHNLNPNRSSHSNTLKIILHISSIHHFITSLILFEHSWNYSNQPKQIINIQLIQIYKTHIFFYFNKITIIIFQWVKYHLTACTPTLISPRLNPQSAAVHNILHQFSFHPIIALIFTLNRSMTILPINCLSSYLIIILGLSIKSSIYTNC
jgi:hypothetical protein